MASRFIAGDAPAGILVAEDLGRHPSLLDLLLGHDEAAARQGLLAFAGGLGTLHAQTARLASTYDERRAQLGPPNLDADGLIASERCASAGRKQQRKSRCIQRLHRNCRPTGHQMLPSRLRRTHDYECAGSD